MTTDPDRPEDPAAELRARWRRKGAPQVGVIPREAIANTVRDQVSEAVDRWLRGEVSARRGDEPEE
jgi:hypothetical protein